jgi:hypothetical protein
MLVEYSSRLPDVGRDSLKNILYDDAWVLFLFWSERSACAALGLSGRAFCYNIFSRGDCCGHDILHKKQKRFEAKQILATPLTLWWRFIRFLKIIIYLLVCIDMGARTPNGINFLINATQIFFSCHLKKFSENKKERTNRNEFTKFLASVPKHVDNFHFKNHVDPWCHKMCNPKFVFLFRINSQL